MEMNVTVSFRFEDDKKHQGLTDAFKNVYYDQNKASNNEERASIFKSSIRDIFDSDDLQEFVDSYSNDFEGLEEMKINKGSTTRLDFLCGSTGDMFADDFQILLKELGAKTANVKYRADYDE